MHRSGFTIVEIIIVIVVLGFLTTLAVFGSSAVLEQTRNSEAESKLVTLRSALEKYHSKNNEYPSAMLLANGGNGRSLSDVNYTFIAQTLGVNVDVLKNGTYKFVPCANGSSLCCSFNGNGECELTSNDGDSRNIFYVTRAATQAADGSALTYKAPVSGCTYTLAASDTPNDAGYSAYMLMYRNFTDNNWWESWRVMNSDKGKHSRGAWCALYQPV